jgi:hypothetical protein
LNWLIIHTLMNLALVRIHAPVMLRLSVGVRLTCSLPPPLRRTGYNMVLHKHGEYLYQQVAVVLQKRSEDLLERLDSLKLPSAAVLRSHLNSLANRIRPPDSCPSPTSAPSLTVLPHPPRHEPGPPFRSPTRASFSLCSTSRRAAPRRAVHNPDEMFLPALKRLWDDYKRGLGVQTSAHKHTHTRSSARARDAHAGTHARTHECRPATALRRAPAPLSPPAGRAAAARPRQIHASCCEAAPAWGGGRERWEVAGMLLFSAA